MCAPPEDGSCSSCPSHSWIASITASYARFWLTVVHIARRDLTSVKTRMWVAFVFAIAGVIALEASGWGGAIYPEYVAAFVVVFTASQVALSILNRPLETRADAEGAGG